MKSTEQVQTGPDKTKNMTAVFKIYEIVSFKDVNSKTLLPQLLVKHIAIPPGNLGPKDNFWVAKKKQL